MQDNYKMKVLKAVCSVALILVLTITGTIQKNDVSAKVIPNNRTGIPDKNLYQAILFELDKKSDQKITDDDVEDLYYIGDFFGGDNRNKNIKSLKGIEKFKNLLGLEIPINRIERLKEISKIPNLRSLTIRNGKLKHINDLNKLHKLESLTLENIKVKDWSGIKKLKKLTSLKIIKCNFKKIKLIRGLKNLEYLVVNKTKLKNLKGIENFKNLKGLYVQDNYLKNIAGVEELTQLAELDVSNNKLKKLPSLKKLKKFELEHSSFASNKISERQLRKRLPSQVPKWWINREVILQKTKKKLAINDKEDITGLTKQIVGITEKQAKVKLLTLGDEEIKAAKSNTKGKFVFDNLNLEPYSGKQLKVVLYKLVYDYINGEGGYVKLKTVKFRVKKVNDVENEIITGEERNATDNPPITEVESETTM